MGTSSTEHNSLCRERLRLIRQRNGSTVDPNCTQESDVAASLLETENSIVKNEDAYGAELDSQVRPSTCSEVKREGKENAFVNVTPDCIQEMDIAASVTETENGPFKNENASSADLDSTETTTTHAGVKRVHQAVAFATTDTNGDGLSRICRHKSSKHAHDSMLGDHPNSSQESSGATMEVNEEDSGRKKRPPVKVTGSSQATPLRRRRTRQHQEANSAIKNNANAAPVVTPNRRARQRRLSPELEKNLHKVKVPGGVYSILKALSESTTESMKTPELKEKASRHYGRPMVEHHRTMLENELLGTWHPNIRRKRIWL